MSPLNHRYARKARLGNFVQVQRFVNVDYEHVRPGRHDFRGVCIIEFENILDEFPVPLP